MITYSVYINNIFQSTIQAEGRQQAVIKACEQYGCAGIHVSKECSMGVGR